jgi:hypothetical protein
MQVSTPSTVRRRTLLRILLLSVCLTAPFGMEAASPLRFYGKILGIVTDAGGVPQMGATVLLFDRMEKLLSQITTNERGAFGFDNLAAGPYSVRVSLSRYLPVLRSHILVQPGGQSVLNVSLAGLFSSIDLVYPGPEHRALMSEDWKWVLRTASSTRPVLRLLPEWNPASQRTSREGSAIFSGTRGLVKVSAGDGGRVTSLGSESDLGTAFALATSLFGTNQLQVSGNVGYASLSGLPSAGFRTTYSHGQTSPEVSLTMRQLFLPGRVGAAMSGTASAPVFRTMSLSVDDGIQLTDDLRLEYGFSLDSVTFFDRLNYASPYGKLKYALSENDSLELAYSSGVPRSDAVAGPKIHGAALQNEINTLALFPRVSLRGGRAKVQRSENFELGYARKLGSRTYQAAAFRESVTNAALMMGGAADVPAGDVLPDLFSGASVFNAGRYQSLGYMAAVTQNLGGNLRTTVIYSSGGALLAGQNDLESWNPDELRSMIRQGRRRAVTSQIAGTSPWTGTQFVASYQWTDRRAATPTHYFVTQGTRAEAGLNMYVRQPIPTFLSLPVRLEASADLRNLLAQGYLPFTVDGRQMYLMHTPRSVRGGLSFIF